MFSSLFMTAVDSYTHLWQEPVGNEKSCILFKTGVLGITVKVTGTLNQVCPNSQSFICHQAWNHFYAKRNKYSLWCCKNVVQSSKNSGSASTSFPCILSDPKNSSLQSVAWKQLMPSMQHPVPPSILFLMHMQLVFNQNNKFSN